MLNVLHHRLSQLQLFQSNEGSFSQGESPSSSSCPATPTSYKDIFPLAARQPTNPLVDEPALIQKIEGQPKQSIIDGEVWPPIFKPINVRSAKALKVRPDDVFVCTYPKCGTTWIQHICSQLMEKDGPRAGKELCQTSPMIERMGGSYTDALESPRLLKTHFSTRNCPKSTEAKYIFCVRNPKDCLTSYYFHNRNFKIYDWENGDFNVFFELFANGELAFGDYFDHLKSWLEFVNLDNVLFLTYEDMMADLSGAIKKIGHFLGGKAAEMVEDPEKFVQIVEESTLDSMKKNQERWFPENCLREQTFIRKGGSRDWKNYFTKEQSDRIDALFRTRLAGTIAENWWRSEMAWDDTYDLTSSTEDIPQITLTVTAVDKNNNNEDDGYAGSSEEADDLPPSVSRRGSCSTSTLNPRLCQRRDSMDSVTATPTVSTGYGSVWSKTF